MQNTIDIVKRNKTDVLQFGDVVYRTHPEAWKKMEGEWSNRYFPDTDVDITVNAYVRSEHKPHWIGKRFSAVDVSRENHDDK